MLLFVDVGGDELLLTLLFEDEDEEGQWLGIFQSVDLEDGELVLVGEGGFLQWGHQDGDEGFLGIPRQ